MTEPTRWANDDTGLTEDERRVFSAGLRPEAIPHEMEQAVWGALTAKLPAAAASATVGAATAKGVTAASLLKVGLTGVLLGSVTTAAWVGGERLISPGTPRTPVPSAVVRAPAAPGGGIATTAPLPTPALDPIPELPTRPPAGQRRNAARELPAEVPAASSPSTARPERSVASFPVPAPAVPSAAGSAVLESRRIADARTRLRAGDARGALTALDGLRREFPAGVLIQERDALTIEALLALGERARAKLLAAEFLARYPTSPHRAAVERAFQ